jgi:hypothetical protein
MLSIQPLKVMGLNNVSGDFISATQNEKAVGIDWAS